MGIVATAYQTIVCQRCVRCSSGYIGVTATVQQIVAVIAVDGGPSFAFAVASDATHQPEDQKDDENRAEYAAADQHVNLL